MELDSDLKARQEARAAAAAAEAAGRELARFPQSRLDAIVEAAAEAFSRAAPELAALAVEETGFGNIQDKAEKNRFASIQVARAMKGMTVVGPLRKEPGLWEIGVPVGAIAAIVPSTNPTSTVCYKALIAIKAGCSIVFSPHPKALSCTLEAARIVSEAAEKAGAPKNTVQCLSVPSLEGCRELMQAPGIRLILATGGPGMVKAAYSSGKPAIGVGAGNGPAYLHPSADTAKALKDILRSKTFDNGTICASEQSLLIHYDMEKKTLEQARGLGYYVMEEKEAAALGSRLFRPNGALDPRVVGKTAVELAAMAGFPVPGGTKVLLAREEGVGENHPYSLEKLCPVLALYVVEGEQQALETSLALLQLEGRGHTFVIHAGEEQVIERFSREIPVSRFLVNTPAALGGIGATTELFPALTLGCGAAGGSASSNNISPMDLVNIRRVAWGREEKANTPPACENEALVELLTERILEKLKKR